MLLENPYPEKLLICGFGSIGRRYLKLILEKWPRIKIGIFTSQQLISIKDSNKIDFFTNDLNESLRWKPNAVFICNPASLHIKYALFFLKMNIPVLIEKPLGTGKENINDLKTLKKLSKNCVALVGYVLRHEEEFKYLNNFLNHNKFGNITYGNFKYSSWLPEWRKNINYTKSVSAKKNLGGGALLELSHEIDLAQSFLGKINLIDAKIENSGKLNIDVEDKVHLLGNTETCEEIIINLDFCSKETQRISYFKSENGTIKWDIYNKYIEIKISNHERKRINFNKDPNIKFINQIKHFFYCIYKSNRPICTIEDGRMVLDFINKARSLSNNYLS